MKEKLRFLGLDVHAETIAAAIAEPDGEVRSLGTIPNRMESIRKLVKKLGSVDKLRACYEAGPTGYVVYWQMAELGVKVRGDRAKVFDVDGLRAGCEVEVADEVDVAPSDGRDAFEDCDSFEIGRCDLLLVDARQKQGVVEDDGVDDQPGTLVPYLLLSLGFHSEFA